MQNLIFSMLLLVLSVNIQASDELWKRGELIDIYPHGTDMCPNMQLPPNNNCPYVYTLYDLAGKSEKMIIKQNQVTFQVIESVVESTEDKARLKMIRMQCTDTDVRVLSQQSRKKYCCFWNR